MARYIDGTIASRILLINGFDDFLVDKHIKLVTLFIFLSLL